MAAALIFGTLFGLGALSVLTAQSRGKPQATMAARLAALSPREGEPQRPRERVFRAEIFEQLLRPHLEQIGRWTTARLARLGVSAQTIEDRLRMTGDRGGLALFYGQKLASALIGFAFLPAASTVGAAPATPMAFWLALAAGGFLMPDLVLRARAQAARRRLREELVRLTEMLTLAVSAGLGLEGALDQVTNSTQGQLFAEVRRLLRDAQLKGEPASIALSRLPEEVGLAEIEPLCTAIKTASAQGTPITQALRAQSRSVRERRRLELIEAGERAQIRMLLPVGALILPAFFVIVLYPAAVQLLRITGL